MNETLERWWRRRINPCGDHALQALTRLLLGLLMIGAGLLHLTAFRGEFAKLVPDWVPLDKDAVVLASGVVELLLGAACWLLPSRRGAVGLTLAAFFVAVFPGNLHHYLSGSDAFGLDSSSGRFVRLLFQPVLVLAAMWAAGFPRARRRD